MGRGGFETRLRTAIVPDERVNTMTQELESMAPEEAVDEYLKSRQQDAARSTIQNHRYRLKPFLEFCSVRGIDDLNEMSGRINESYKNWRVSEEDLAPITLEQQLRTFRKFLRFCESIEAVEKGTAAKLIIPKVGKGEAVRDDAITHEEATAILDYLDRYHYASRDHALFFTLYHTGMRRGAAVSLDVDDWHPEEEYLSIRHRPDAANPTPLKLQDQGERNVSIVNPSLVRVLNDYTQEHRIPQEEPDGREPLFTTRQGRATGGTIQAAVYRMTRPCWYSDGCPHDRDEASCEAATSSESYSECPSSVSPHPIRRSAIVHHLNENIRKDIASERMAVSVDTLDEHYDSRSIEEKREARRDELNNLM